jgi:hypothetical protein
MTTPPALGRSVLVSYPPVKHPCGTVVILDMGIITTVKVQAPQEAMGGSL